MPRPTAALLDAFGDLDDEAAAVARLWNERRAREEELAAHRADVERAQREADWLRHAVEELRRLSPEPAEETALAERRDRDDAGREGRGRPARGA